MIEKHLGVTIDIHAGGQDLVFPHHENEIAQSTCANHGEIFARYWLHNGFLSINNEKMSKSLGNISLVRDLLKDYPGEVIRLALLSAHYRQPLEWSDDTLESAKKMLDRIYGSIRDVEIKKSHKNKIDIPISVMNALFDDMNTPKALAEIFDLVKALNKEINENKKSEIASQILASGQFMGLLEFDPKMWFSDIKKTSITENKIEELINARELARSQKNFEEADLIRAKLEEKGINLEDTADGVRWSIVN
jgi:cysteinyl-tRNA synthetase